MEQPFKLTVRVVWWMMGFQILFALLCTMGALYILLDIVQSQGSARIIVYFLGLGFLAFLGWSNAFSTIQVTEKSVTVTVFHGRYRITWDEVQKVIHRGSLIALIGNDKRVVLALEAMDKNGNKMLEYFLRQIEARNIQFTTDEPVPLTQYKARV